MSRITFELLRAAAVIALVLLLTVFGPALDAASTETEVDREIAAWADESPPSIDSARIEEWVQAAKEANPYLTEHDLSRVRMSAMLIEGKRP